MNLRPRAIAAILVAACTVVTMVSVTPAMAGKPAPRKGSIAFCSSTYQITEGQNWDSSYGRGTLTIDLCRTAKGKYRNASATIWVQTSGGTATEGSDFYHFEGIASFAAGSTTATVQVYIRPEGVLNESDETFTVSLDNSVDPGWTAGPDATVTIKEMPAPPAPTHLQETVVSSTQIDWTWTAPTFDYGPVYYSLIYNWQAPGTEGREYNWVGVIPTSSWTSTSYTQIQNYCEEPPDSWGPYWFAVLARNLEGVPSPTSTPEPYVGLQCS